MQTMTATSIAREIAVAASFLLAVSTVQAQPVLVCNVVNSPPMAFGNYNPLSMAAHDAQTSFSVSCKGAGQNQLLVSMGPGLAGSVGERQMQRGAARLAYGLYTDIGRSITWGDGTAGTTVVQKKVTPNSNSTFQLYGRIQPRQNASPGTYSDSVTVRLDF